MGWVKIDDQLHGHPKVSAAWQTSHAAVGLHLLALSYCSSYLTDGLVPASFVTEKMPEKKVRDRAVPALTDSGMWEAVDGGWLIHGYLDYNPSRAEVEARRLKDSNRKRNGVPKESTGKPTGVQKDSASRTRGRASAAGRAPGSGTGSVAVLSSTGTVVDELLAKLAECPRFVVDDINTRVQVENAIGSHPDADHMAAAREAVIWASDPGWDNTNPGAVFSLTLRKQIERKPKPGSEKLSSTEWDDLARELEAQEQGRAA